MSAAVSIVRTAFGAAALALGCLSGAQAQSVSTRVIDESAKRQLTILIGPVDLPMMSGHDHAATSMVLPPVETVTIPRDVYLYGFSFDVIDADGNPVPNAVVHHLNLIDPDHRELFLPISQRIGAVGGETGSQEIPGVVKYLFGVPLKAGQHVVVSLMMHNPTGKDVRGATVRYHWKYLDGKPWPLFGLQPFQMDVAFPAGDKSFDLPPGESGKSWEGKPSVPGRVLLIGGHLHEMATSLKFEDATTNTVIWEGKPYSDEEGNVNHMPIGNLYKKLGAKLDPDHSYRVTVSYVNPTADTIRAGGMGVIGGVFLPGETWPATNPTDSLYVLDRRHYLREVRGQMGEMKEIKPEPKKAAEHHH